jgi:hypothetical protein
MNKTQAVRFIEVKSHFWRLNAINYFVAYIQWKVKFQLAVSENKVVFPPHPYTIKDILTSIISKN